jgi:hypothetical protein
MSPAPVQDSRRRALRIALNLTLVALATLALLEGVCRVAVYNPDSSHWPVFWRLRDPWRFGRYQADDAYWEVAFLERPEAKRIDSTRFDPHLGWGSELVAEADYRHRDEDRLGSRRPVILVGDSYAGGVVPETWLDFPSLFARGDLSAEFGLLNYGVGGYGLDQIWLMLQRALEHHAGRRAVAIVSFMVDDDIDRCLLSFRDWPKPRLHVRDGRLVRELERVPRVEPYFAEHSALSPLLATHFLGRVLNRSRSPGTAAQEREKQALGRAILGAMVADLRAHGVPFLFVLFHHKTALERPEILGWRAGFAEGVLDELGAPWVNVRPAFLAHRERSGRTIDEYFLPPEHPSSGHYNPLGNAVAFEVMREGLRVHLGLGAGGNLVLPQDVRATSGVQQPLWREDGAEHVGRRLVPPYLEFALPLSEEAGVSWRLGGAGRSLRARVHLISTESEGATARLRVRADERNLLEQALGSADALVLDLDLRGVDNLTVSAGNLQGNPGSARVVLSEVAFEAAETISPALR